MLTGCGDSGGNRLFGSAGTSYGLEFSRVEVQKQYVKSVLDAVYIKYALQSGQGSAVHYPVKLVVKAPVTVGQEKDLVAQGALIRLMPDQSQFPAMERGRITFEALEDKGGEASGIFYITFKDSNASTLNGEFHATVDIVTLP